MCVVYYLYLHVKNTMAIFSLVIEEKKSEGKLRFKERFNFSKIFFLFFV